MNARTLEFIPTVCTEHKKKDKEGKDVLEEGQPVIEQPTFSGCVVLRVPSFDERYQALEDMGIQAEATGEVKTVERNIFKVLRQMVEGTKKFYVEVKLKRLSDGAEFKTFEDLSADPDCDEILLEVARSFREGFRPGKS